MRSLAPLHSKRLENTMANVLDVRGALPQIFVAQALIGSRRRLVGPLPGEGIVLMPIPDRLLGGFQQFRIFENKRLRTEDFRLFCSEGLSERISSRARSALAASIALLSFSLSFLYH